MRTLLFQSLTSECLGKGQNTFRQGTKWADLMPGDKVKIALVDGTFIGEAKVCGVVVNELHALLNFHATMNHFVIANEALRDANSDDEVLLAELARIYGPLTDRDLFTAVYVELPGRS